MKKKYSKRLSFGYDENGDRIRKYFYYDTKAELEQQIEEYRKTLRISTSGKITFKDYADRWLETYKSNRQPATYNMYQHSISLMKDIHSAPLYAINNTDCQEIINEYRDKPRTCAILSLTMKSIFKKAVEDGKIDRNPCVGLELPKYRAKEKRALTDTEKEAIRNADLKPAERLFVSLLYTYGLRPSEAFALEHKDITRASITVNKALGYDKHRSYVKETKTGDTRTLPMTDKVYEDYLAVGVGDGLIFRDSFGNRLSKTTAEKFKRNVMSKIMVAQGFDSNLTAYVFRHNRITDLVYDGVMTGKITTKMVAKLMGNSEKMVMDVYSHLKDEKEDVQSLYNSIVL